MANGNAPPSEAGSVLQDRPQIKGNIALNLPSKSIKVQGSPYLVTLAKQALQEALSDVRKGIEGSPNPIFKASQHYWHQFERSTMTPQTGPSSVKTFPVDVDQDDLYIQIWKTYVLPRLPNILSYLPSTNYSACLVRLGREEDQSSLCIRIRCSGTYPRKNTQNTITKEIDEICNSHHAPIRTKFIKGTLRLIAGGYNDTLYEGNEEEEEDAGDAPLEHHRRYWKDCGMGASLGLRCCSVVSGTLGGHILIDQIPHILTTAHFVENALVHGSLISDGDPRRFDITSPSLLDAQNLRDDLEETLADWERGKEEELKKEGTYEITLDNARQRYSSSPLQEYAEKWFKELNYMEDKFIIGKVTHRCFKTIEVGHKVHRSMDWAIASINNDRKGKNRHRHRDPPPYDEKHFADEGLHSYGTGEECTKIAPPSPGAKVHYVGAGTGHQPGKINPADTFLCQDGQETLEFSMILDGSSHKDHAGDSGAWVIQSEGNQLVGMLWGEEAELLHLTSIKEIFDHIKAELRSVNDLCLPKGGHPYVSDSRRISRTDTKPRKPRRVQIISPSLPWRGDPLPSFNRPVSGPASPARPILVEQANAAQDRAIEGGSTSSIPSLVSMDTSGTDEQNDSPCTPPSLLTPLLRASLRALNPVMLEEHPKRQEQASKHSIEFLLEQVDLDSEVSNY